MKTGTNKLLLVLYCIFASQLAAAEGILISNTNTRLVEDVYHLDANLEFDIDSEVLEALEHGVTIRFDIYILIKRERNWLWDPKVKEETLSYRLEQHPLSKRYLITDLGNGYRQQFHNRKDALKFLGTIRDHFLISQTVLTEGERYICMVKAELNTETLPPVIRPIAFVSKKWQMDSDWTSWLLAGPEEE